MNEQTMINAVKNFMSSGGNPSKMLENAFFNNVVNSNPMLSNLVKMAKSGKSGNVETFARNFCKENGMDFDNEFNKFMENFK